MSERRNRRARHAPVDSPGAWLRLLTGLAVVFALFHWSAAQLGSDRGQAGWIVAVVVLLAIVGAEHLLFSADAHTATANLGLGVPRRRGMAFAAAVTVALWVCVPVFSLLSGRNVTLTPGWAWFVPGLFAQAGIAEEALFRAYLFGHLRASRTFWPAAAWSLLPFVAVHVLLFFTMPWPVATAALLLSAAIAIPFARLYEEGGHTIWAPAIVHAAIQGTVKVVAVPDEWTIRFALAWMVVSAIVPWAVFFARPVKPRAKLKADSGHLEV